MKRHKLSVEQLYELLTRDVFAIQTRNHIISTMHSALEYRPIDVDELYTFLSSILKDIAIMIENCNEIRYDDITSLFEEN